jgi:hypothetical protein
MRITVSTLDKPIFNEWTNAAPVAFKAKTGKLQLTLKIYFDHFHF